MDSGLQYVLYVVEDVLIRFKIMLRIDAGMLKLYSNLTCNRYMLGPKLNQAAYVQRMVKI